MIRLTCQAVLLSLLVPVFATPVSAQEDTDAEDIAQIRASLIEMRELWEQRDWKQLELCMSEQGFLSMKRLAVQSSFVFLPEDSSYPFGDPKVIREKFVKAFEDHGIRDLEIPDIQHALDLDDVEGMEAMYERMAVAADKLLAQSMDHDGLLTALVEAIKDVPQLNLGAGLFGEVSEIELEPIAGGVTAVLRFRLPDIDVADGVTVSVSPAALRFVREDDSLKFDGVDISRTMKAIKEMSPAVFRSIDDER